MKKLIFAALAVASIALPAAAIVVSSGLDIGDMVSAFEPHHLSGPDKGTDTCPVCKYGNTPAIQVWANNDSMTNLRAIATDLNARVGSSKHGLKAFVVNIASCPMDKADKVCDHCDAMITKYATAFKTDKIAMTTLSVSNEAIKDYKINTSKDVKNTIFVYKNRKVVAKFVNLKADKAGLNSLNAAIAKIDN